MGASRKRGEVVYRVVSDAVMDARIKVVEILRQDNLEHPTSGESVDMVLARLQDDAASSAVRALTVDIRQPAKQAIAEARVRR